MYRLRLESCCSIYQAIHGTAIVDDRVNTKIYIMDITKNTQHEEGKVATMIEDQTAKIPSDVFLWSALGAMAVSAGLKIAGKKHEALFVGQWAAPFLLLGLYNKLVKLEGHDAKDKQQKENTQF